MVKRKTQQKIRKAHRYLGLFLGIQFLLWTISGIYFSWTDIDEIHGDHYRKEKTIPRSFNNLIGLSEISIPKEIFAIELREIADVPYYWINDQYLIHAVTGVVKNGITEQEAVKISEKNMLSELIVADIERIDEVGKHHEYREKPLPAYVISYESAKNVKAYVSIDDGSFQTVRYRDWRWFDFLWMTHTMDYEGRDNFNTVLLRGFSLMGLITVLSGFTLFYISSPTIRKRVIKK